MVLTKQKKYKKLLLKICSPHLTIWGALSQSEQLVSGDTLWATKKVHHHHHHHQHWLISTDLRRFRVVETQNEYH